MEKAIINPKEAQKGITLIALVISTKCLQHIQRG